ncbi:MAG: GNAT family N-acetyltransferase [Flavobacteriales bacterium]|uniref:GNAT family N-acetyltransferase n=1 Tax=Candidatus Ulvibacter alkanivorans TaxID=2267620 RepID=UPI001FE480E3|nr:GNAT family N-acetyltransferase [Candidatus Ulvibacter alkanivorans]MCH2491032.1 GNAT family N-acetyltransferase [Flavobacteriales bacterium]
MKRTPNKSEATYKAIRYTANHKDEWDAFVATAKNATFLFQRDFMDYHSDRFEDHSVMVYKDDALYAVLPANIRNDALYSHQGLTYGSFVLQEKAKLLYALEAFKTMLQFLSENKITSLEIKVIPTFYNKLPADELVYFLYKAEAQLIKRDVLMVIDYDHQLRFQKNRREGINKAKRNGLTVRVDSNFEGFWNEILIPNLNKKHGIDPVHSLDEIKMLAKRFPKQIQQVNVYKGDTLVAGTTVFLTHTTIHPQYVSGNVDKNSFGSLDLAYDFIINHFKEDKRYFDFNISSEEDGKVLNTGLIFWKESCGARAFTADNYLIETASYNKLSLQLK